MRHESLAAKTCGAALALLLAGCTGAPERAGQAPARRNGASAPEGVAGGIVGPVWVAEETAAARISVVAA